MRSHYRVVVIGGGIVGTSILYHLARRGWSDIALVERAELTAGSTWHAAAGFHALNDDPNVAALQSYTINLYRQIEAESGQSVGMHMPGGYSLATTPARWEWLKAECAVYQTLGIGARLATPEEIVADCPIVDPAGLLGGLFDPSIAGFNLGLGKHTVNLNIAEGCVVSTIHIKFLKFGDDKSAYQTLSNTIPYSK